MELFLLNFAGPVNSATTQRTITESKLLCQGPKNQSYFCESGYCCDSQCCSHYYELWWFWLVWTIIIILICCCVCHHRRTKHRLQQQQRQHEINLIAYREAHNYTSLPFYLRFLPSYLLPAYEEVVNRPPTPPPPYSPAQTTITDIGAGGGDPPPSTDQTGPPGSTSPAPNTSDAPPQQQLLSPQVPGHGCDLGPRGVGAGQSQDKLTPPPTPRASCEGHCRIPAHLQGYTDTPLRGKNRDCCKEAGLGQMECPSHPPLHHDDKERNSGRHRRFTGDSGIEVCVCGRGVGEEEEEGMKELQRLMDQQEAPSTQDFCDSCQPLNAGIVNVNGCHGDGPREGERGEPEGEERAPLCPPPLPQEGGQQAAVLSRPPVSLHLHTIREQDGRPTTHTHSPSQH